MRKIKKVMDITNWDLFDKQMQQWSSFFVNEVKIPEGKTNKIATLIAEEISRIPKESKKEIIDSISNPISIQDRLNELVAFQGWMDIAHNLRSPYITRAQVIVQNYVCFVYLGEACEPLAETSIYIRNNCCIRLLCSYL